jgi:hypothetical protein
MSSFKAELEEVLKQIGALQKEVKSLSSQLSMKNETIANIHQTTMDLSRKLDEIVNVTGIKSPVTGKKEPKKEPKETGTPSSRPKSKAVKSKTVVKKKKLYGNIMTYFRSKYLADQAYFHTVMDEKETEALFAEHEKDLKGKKGDKKTKAQVGFLYKAISKNKAKLNSLRTMMDKENSEHLKSQGTEAVKDSSDDEDDGNSGSDSDSDE